jgi:hypothetical protein
LTVQWERGFGRNWLVVISGLPFGILFVLVFLLLHFFPQMAFAIAMHPGLVLIDAIFDIGSSVEIIVGCQQIPAK